jgi:hypothetical protein
MAYGTALGILFRPENQSFLERFFAKIAELLSNNSPVNLEYTIVISCCSAT